MTEWLSLAVGPAGAAVVALLFALLAGREMRRRHQAERQTLLEQLNQRTAEAAAARLALDEEHAARLRDAKEQTQTLLQLSDRIHQTLNNLSALTRSARAPPPR